MQVQSGQQEKVHPVSGRGRAFREFPTLEAFPFVSVDDLN